MSAADVTLLLAAVTATIGGCVVAIAVSPAAINKRLARTLLASSAIVVVGATAYQRGLRLNLTPSMPVGVYRTIEPTGEAIRRGAIVAVCAPGDAAALGRIRGYLSRGDCIGDVEPLLKTVVAAAGDTIIVTSDALRVNGCRLPRSGQLAYDRAHRRIVGWPAGEYRLRASTVWLYGNNDRSWDSRYWGPVSVQNVVALARPVFTTPFPDIAACNATADSAPRA